MEQPPLIYEDIFDALRHVVQASGGAKKVGPKLFPAKDPEPAGRYLMDCLNSSRAEKLDAEHLIHLFRIGHESSCHAAIGYMARQSGYAEPIPLNPEEEINELQRQFVGAVRTLKMLSGRIESLNGSKEFAGVGGGV